MFEAADKRVRSLIFCVRTSGKPYALNDADFFVLHTSKPFYTPTLVGCSFKHKDNGLDTQLTHNFVT